MNDIFAVKSKDKEVTQEWNKCRNATISCNKNEDKSLKFVAKCKTGKEALKTKLKSLYRAKDMLNKTNTKTNSSISQTRNTVTITFTSFTINKTDTSSITNSSFFLNIISWLTITVEALDIDDIGTNNTVRYVQEVDEKKYLNFFLVI